MNTSSTSSNTTSNSIDFNNSPNEDTPLLNTNDIKGPKTSTSPLSNIDKSQLNMEQSIDPLLKVNDNKDTSLPISSQVSQQAPQLTVEASEKVKTMGEIAWDFILYGPQPSQGKKKGPWNWYDCWDVAANTKEIFIRSREGDLAFLDGIRALAYLWVLSDHMEQAFSMEITGFSQWWRNQTSETVRLADGNKGDQGVTSFFFLSGFLIPFIFTKMVSGAKKTLKEGDVEPAFSYHAFEFIFRRYMRLAPTLMTGTLVALVYGYYIQEYSSNSYSQFYVTCNQFWWQNAVFVNNMNGIIGTGDCYDSVWTISCEFQLYILTIPVVYFYCWKPEYGYIANAIFTATSFALRVYFAYMVDVDKRYSWGAYVYLPSWTRAAEYGVGITIFFIYDYFFSSSKKKAQIQPIGELKTYFEIIVRVSFYIVVYFFLAFGLFYILSDETWWKLSYYQYEGFSYFLWAATLGSIAILSIENVLWPVKYFLSWYVWYPIAQLAYTGGVLNMVISHATAVASIVTFGNDWNDDTSLWTYMYLYILVAASSLIFGYILSLLVERPFMNLAKAVPQFYKLFGPTKKEEPVQV